MLLVTGKTLWQYPSTNQLVIDYTNCIVDIVCHILNIEDDTGKPRGTITSKHPLQYDCKLLISSCPKDRIL